VVLEPVPPPARLYISAATDDARLHHLFAEVIDNSMDEALGPAMRAFIEVEVNADGSLTVTADNRTAAIPVDPILSFFPRKIRRSK